MNVLLRTIAICMVWSGVAMIADVWVKTTPTWAMYKTWQFYIG